MTGSMHAVTTTPVGVCKMGVDDRAVMDPPVARPRHRWIARRRSSIMPVLLSGNTNAPTMMIAEKAADMIKAGGEARMRADPVMA